MRLIALSFVRFFARTPWTTLSALFGAALGVASTVAVHLIGLSVADSLNANLAPHLRSLTHIATKPAATMEDYFELRRRWRAGDLPGVRALVPLVDGQVVDGGRRYHVIGADWLALYTLSDAPGGDVFRLGSVVVNADHSLDVGDRLHLADEQWSIAGVVDSGVRGGVFTDIGDALAMLNAPPNQLSRVGVAMDDPWQQVRAWLEALLPGLSAGLPQIAYAQWPVSDSVFGAPDEFTAWELRPVAVETPGANLANSILFNLGALGTLALLVAWFLIHQVCVLWLRRQLPVMENLTVVGASRAELAACFISVIAALGVLATLLGLVGGTWLAEMLAKLSTAGLGELPSQQLSVAVVVKALLSGLGVAVVAGWMALRGERGAATAKARFSLRWATGFVGLAALAGIGIGAPETGLAGGFLAILASALLALVLLRLLLRTLRRRFASGGSIASVDLDHKGKPEAGSSGACSANDAGGLSPSIPAWERCQGWAARWPAILRAPTPASEDSERSRRTGRRRFTKSADTSLRLWLPSRQYRHGRKRGNQANLCRLSAGALLTRLAVREATWHGRDVGAALGALVLAVATSVGIGLMVASFKLDFERMLTQRLAYEQYVDPAGGNAQALRRAMAERWPDARLQVYGDVRARIAGRVVAIGHADYSEQEVARYGHRAALGANEGLASESLLLALDVDVGDFVDLAGSPVRIAGAFADYGGGVPRLLLQNETAIRLFGPLHFNDIAASGIPGMDLEIWLTENAPRAKVRERERARARALEIFDRSFAITNALTLLALTVAVAGLYNAMTGLRLNRVATRQLLTTLGVSVWEDRLIELIRAIGLGVGAVLLALPLGMTMGWILCDVINPRAFGWRIELSLPFSALAWPTALGFLAAVIAAIAPTPRERFEAN